MYSLSYLLQTVERYYDVLLVSKGLRQGNSLPMQSVLSHTG
jgi:hypothetical protein